MWHTLPILPMNYSTLSILILLVLYVATLSTPLPTPIDASIQLNLQVFHYPLRRRGGSLITNPSPQTSGPTNQLANLTHLIYLLSQTVSRFDHTARELSSNRLIRKPKETKLQNSKHGGLDLMGMSNIGIGQEGRWYIEMGMGEPEQKVEVEVDFLSSEWFVWGTTATRGWTQKGYKEIRSESYGLLKQLVSKGLIKGEVWSIMLIDGETGILSLGGTAEMGVERVMREVEWQLEKAGEAKKGSVGKVDETISIADEDSMKGLRQVENLNKNVNMTRTGQSDIGIVASPPPGEPQSDSVAQSAATPGINARLNIKPITERNPISNIEPGQNRNHNSNWQTNGKWHFTPVLGAEGWWQILLQSVQVNAASVLRNIPVILDINTPFPVLLPPFHAKTLYASIPGSKRLFLPLNLTTTNFNPEFYTYPCLNPPIITLQLSSFASFQMPILSTASDILGGGLSLGRLDLQGGYCVGGVVGVELGFGQEGAGMGMGVLGEGAFKGVGAVFDVSAAVFVDI
ncbi:MAG: hypothetical protein M1834_008634 [Cirrosporium novae-zelandiae]|nr:MAG: hypothetical protein M1834_008634 [Cirrosporium novae-zelandiae]